MNACSQRKRLFTPSARALPGGRGKGHGRTIRQFVVGVLAAPVLFSIVWFGAFGWSSFAIERDAPGTLVDPVVGQSDVATALFTFLEGYPFTVVTQVVAVLLVVVFFVTSVDSAGLVMDMISNGYSEPAPARQRIFCRTSSSSSACRSSSSPAS